MNEEPVRSNDFTPEVLERFQITPLPTVYGGIKYRSRIEARWAVFFDALRIKCEYEREGYDLGDGLLYLPDFWLPKQRCWVEIKGAAPDDDACEKAHRLAVGSKFPVYVFFGGHTMPDGEFGAPVAYAFFADESADNEYSWCECDTCGAFGIQYEGRSDRLPCKMCYMCSYYAEHGHFDGADIHKAECKRWGKGCPRSRPGGDRGHNANSRRLNEAYQAARAARFGRCS